MLGLKETKAKRDQATQDQNLPTTWETPQETKLGKIKVGLELSGITQFGELEFCWDFFGQEF